jgi:lysyl-tRNA synthetase class II
VNGGPAPVEALAEEDGMPSVAEAAESGKAVRAALAREHRPVSTDAAECAGRVMVGKNGLLPALNGSIGASLGPEAAQAILATAGGWYRRLIARQRLTSVNANLSLDRAGPVPEDLSRIPDDPRIPGYPEQELAALGVAAYVRGGNSAATLSFVAALSRGEPRASELYRLFVALEMLRSFDPLCQVMGIGGRGLARGIAYALVASGAPNELHSLLRETLGPTDPWINLEVSARERPDAIQIPAASWIDISTVVEGGKHLDAVEEGMAVVVGGRVERTRRHARIDFADLEFANESVQVAFEHERWLGNVPAGGDWVLARGVVRRSRSDARTVFVEEVLAHQPSLLDKSRRERRFPSTGLIHAQAHTLKTCRRHLEDAGFLEVTTPVLTSSFYGGRSRPYVTRSWATGQDQYLRVTSELALKSVLAAGVPRCYEVGSMFRNEGQDRRHLSDFSLLEAYAAFMSVESMCDIVTQLLRDVAGISGEESPVRRISARDAILEMFECDIDTREGLAAAAKLANRQPPLTTADEAATVYKVLESILIPTSDGILLLDGLPVGISPLIASEGRHHLRVWVAVNGVFVADVAQEEVSLPAVKAALAAQFETDPHPVKRDYSAFLEVLAGGLPPCAGLGLGISALVKAVLRCDDIRQTVIDEWHVDTGRAKGAFQ